MRNGGEDICQLFALMGLMPIWDGTLRRVVDVEVIPMSVLNRPRVDVTLRISGLFRDAFPQIIELIRRGHCIALCDQLEETPSKGSLLKRGVTRVLTPGTIIEEGMLQARRNNWLAAVVFEEVQETFSSYLCFSCGFMSDSRYEIGSIDVIENLKKSPKLVVESQFEDRHRNIVWFPSVINMGKLGMIYPEGTKDKYV